MNAQLLTAFSDAAPVKSGLGALLSKSLGTKDSGVSFASLLSQQSDTLDPKLLEMLQSLEADPKAQKELLGQLKGADVDPNLLSQLVEQLNINTDIKTSITAKPAITVSDKEPNDFIRSTLFIANESKAMRTNATATPSSLADNKSSAKDSVKKQELSTNTITATPTDTTRSSAQLFQAVNPETRLAKNTTENPVIGAKQSVNLNTTAQTQTQIQTSLRAQTASTAATLAKTDLAETVSTSASGQSTANPLNLSTLSHDTNTSGDLNSGLSAITNQAAATTAPSTSPFAAAYNAQVQTPLSQTAQWGADFGRVMVQISQQAGQNNQAGLQTAEIRLDPPELGPLRIVLSVNDSVASAMIFAAHAQTRLTVEQSLPQLQQQLAQAGLSLGEASVSDQGFFAQSEQQSNQDQQNQSSTFSLNGLNQSGDADGSNATNTGSQRIDPNAIIDTFA